MSTVVLVTTTDPGRAVQVALERWTPTLSGVEQVTLLPRAAPPPHGLAEAFLSETVAQVRHAAAARIDLLVSEAREVPRSWRVLAERLGVGIRVFDDLAEADFVEVTPGCKLPLLLGAGAFSIEIVQAVSLQGPQFQGLTRREQDRFLRGVAPPSGQAPDRPSLVLLDAVDAQWPGGHRTCEALALSDDPLAIDLVAAALQQIHAPAESVDRTPLRSRSWVKRAGEQALAATLPVQFDTDSSDSAELARRITELLQESPDPQPPTPTAP